MRTLDAIARIEVAPADFYAMIENGFRSGSLNEVLAGLRRKRGVGE